MPTVILVLAISAKSIDGGVSRLNRGFFDPAGCLIFFGPLTRSHTSITIEHMHTSTFFSKCLTAVALFLALSALQVTHAQRSSQDTPASTELKEPTTGTLYGAVLWGGGHFYAGETNRGLALLGIGAGSLLLGTAISDFDNLTPLYLGYAVSLGAWGYSIYDGGKAVERHNDRIRSLSRAKIELTPAVAAHGDAPAPGMALRVSF